MPTSQAIGRDFSKCTFRTLVPNLPAGIRRMLNRALNSFGTDLNVLPRWSEPVITAKGTKLEREFFPHASNDICCADGVAFCLYQTGVVDFGHDKDYFKSQIAGAIHWAHYYTPTKKNEDICYLVEDIPNTTDPNTIDFRSWLPGDYFVFFDATGDQGADHVNIYLGPFIETVNGEDIPDPVYHMFNSSIGTTGGNAVCTPGPFANHLRYCRSVNRRMWRCRVYAVERLFQNMIGPPVMLAEPTEKPKPGTPPRSELLWSWSERADAPYPAGRSLTWHDGIHLLKEEGMESDGVSVLRARRDCPRALRQGDLGGRYVARAPATSFPRLPNACPRTASPSGKAERGRPRRGRVQTLLQSLHEPRPAFDLPGRGHRDHQRHPRPQGTSSTVRGSWRGTGE
jgi:hypothetical protein